MSTVCLMGYSGHSYVVYDTVKTMGVDLKHYCEISPKISNPYNLDYLGTEQVALQQGFFENLIPVLAIGDNELRMCIGNFLSNAGIKLFTAIHAKSYIASKVSIGEGTVVFAGVVINPLVEIGQGVICNTNCIIEHESSIGEYSHICPGAVLTGNVKIGKKVFIGANAVIKEGLTIGDGAIVGAGSVVVKNVDANTIVYGNPSRIKS
jgi:sugar O-acyltransferase (sialic acid O-acetyltransferase NeuD family)